MIACVGQISGYKLATGNCMFNGVVFDIDDNTGKVVNVYRINERD